MQLLNVDTSGTELSISSYSFSDMACNVEQVSWTNYLQSIHECEIKLKS